MLLFLGRGQVLYLLRQLKPRNHWQKLLEVFCYVFHKIKCNNSIAFITFFFPWNIIKKRWIAKSFLHKPCLFLKEINYFKGFRSLIFFFFSGWNSLSKGPGDNYLLLSVHSPFAWCCFFDTQSARRKAITILINFIKRDTSFWSNNRIKKN